MTATFRIKNWEAFQHYKNRNPPWIRFYNALLDDYAYCNLPDATKSHLNSIWLLASRNDNRLPFDARWIANKISATEQVNLELLATAGFIIVEQPDSKPRASRKRVASDVLAERKQDAMPETETETETETEQRQNSDASHPRSAREPSITDPPFALAPDEPDRPKPKRRGTRLAPDWQPSLTDRQYAIDAGYGEPEVERMAANFLHYWTNGKGHTQAHVDWSLTWKNWIRNELERKPPGSNGGPNGQAARNGHAGRPDPKTAAIAQFLAEPDGPVERGSRRAGRVDPAGDAGPVLDGDFARVDREAGSGAGADDAHAADQGRAE